MPLNVSLRIRFVIWSVIAEHQGSILSKEITTLPSYIFLDKSIFGKYRIRSINKTISIHSDLFSLHILSHTHQHTHTDTHENKHTRTHTHVRKHK